MLLRDLLAVEVPLIHKREIYATAAAAAVLILAKKGIPAAAKK
ncbi:MAG: hypothetical protein ACXW3P_11210 [Rhodospirillales bacterium]